MTEDAITIDSIHDALPAKVQKILEQVRRLAPHARTKTIHLTVQQWRDVSEGIARARQRDKVERPVAMRYAGVRLARWDEVTGEVRAESA